jgi:hypothetical protein
LSCYNGALRKGDTSEEKMIANQALRSSVASTENDTSEAKTMPCTNETWQVVDATKGTSIFACRLSSIVVLPIILGIIRVFQDFRFFSR